jgi:hypothetical protein
MIIHPRRKYLSRNPRKKGIRRKIQNQIAIASMIQW